MKPAMTKSPGRNTLSRRIGPGIWIDLDGNTHLSIPELLAMVDLEDTPENRQAVEAMALKIVLEKFPESEIRKRKTADD